MNWFYLPSAGFALLGLLCLGVEAWNRYFRQASSPFLAPALGFLVLCPFFLIRKRWAYIALSLLALAYVAASLTLGLWGDFQRASVVQCYRDWSFSTTQGRLRLSKPLGRNAPAAGAYISCNFALKSWWDYLDSQPNLCTAFDAELHVIMFLNDQEADGGILREFQINQYGLQGKSLLGEPLDRGALRIALNKTADRLWPKYKIKAIYQVYEQAISPGQTRVIESFARGPKGDLKSFTESSALNLDSKDLFAVYNSQGILTEFPRVPSRSFVFPAKIEVERVLKYELPRVIGPGFSL
ncbi:MAG TPA: hypothetical protein DF383_06830 [Deltaproteobacteria bacterium]|nr:hypothetical protein [Deltaproteobacteria bacterium]